MKLLTETCVRKILRHALSQEDYERVSHEINLLCKRTDVIPIDYINYYTSKHDPVCKNNLEGLINSYIRDVGYNDDQQNGEEQR